MKKLLPGWISLVFLFAIISSCSEKETLPLSFTVDTAISFDCNDGMAKIEINASNGTPAYAYYVIPEEQWLANDNMEDMLTHNNFSMLYRYTFYSNSIEVKGGSPDLEIYYWVAVQDRTGSANIGGTSALSWWKRVSVVCNGPSAE